jgi:ceramide glucosyltransferase
MTIWAALVLALVTGSVVFSILSILAAADYLRARAPQTVRRPPVSILKPLHGVDEGLEENLRTFFLQDYPEFEILFAVREPSDPAVAIVERLRREFPKVPSRLIVTGEPPYPNAKVYSLDKMMAAARNDVLVMSDSDIRVTPKMLQVIGAEFQDERLGVATCPYRAVPGRSFWSKLEAVGMNTEFLAGVLTARLLEGMKFAVGPTITARKLALVKIGGFDRLKDYLAEDFVMGKFAAEAGFRVILSSYVIEHRIGTQPFGANLRHRLRWVRSTRRSRPAGYVGQIFTYPLPLALLLLVAAPQWWPIVLASVLIRALAAWAVAGWVLRDRNTGRSWWMIPLQDIASLLVWVAGFFGNTIAWRGREYYLFRDGRFELVKTK